MNYFTKLTATLGLLLLTACSGAPEGEVENTANAWTLNPLSSGITYVTIKNNDVGEVNRFNEISGSVSTSGKAEFSIALDSVDTNNDIRDPRMREFLFQTGKFPTAKASAKLDMTQFESLSIGRSKNVNLEMTFDLHGITDTRDVALQVTRLGANRVRIDSHSPVLIDAADFGFEAGLAKLQELAGLDSITPVVSVDVSLTFER